MPLFSGKVSSRSQLTATSVIAISLLLVAIFMPETSKMNLMIPDISNWRLINAEVPVNVVFIVLLRSMHFRYVGGNIQSCNRRSW